MHDSVMQFIGHNLRPEAIKGRDILEVGSQDINGSPRFYLTLWGPRKYIGVDTQMGNCVDMVVDGAKVHEHFGENTFDIVLCCEVLEHAKDWKAVISSAKRVLKPDGVMIMTTRGPGFQYHAYPDDFWRFNKTIFRHAFADMTIEVLEDDWLCPGVLLKARKPAEFKEADLSDVAAMPMEQPK